MNYLIMVSKKSSMYSLSKLSSRSRGLAALTPAVLALSSAQADVVLTNTDTGSGPLSTIAFGGLYWDFVNQTYSDSTITGSYAFTTYAKGSNFISFYASPYNVGNKFVSTVNGDEPRIYAVGDTVSALDTFDVGANYGGGVLDVPFYVGFSFEIENNTHYGWALFEFVESGGNHLQVLHEFAYESEAGKAITVGAIPEPGEVAAVAGLVAGSVAALAARRRRKAAAVIA